MRRGEKAVIRIWMPIPPSTKQLEKWQAAGADPAEKPRTRYKLGPVWDRSQVDPLPPPAESVPLDPPITEPDGDTLAWTLPPLSELVAELGCTLIYEDHPAGRGGSFTPSTKQISINRANAVNHQVKTLIHEVIHALGVDYQHYSRAQAEVIVDTTTLVVLGGLGLDVSGETVPYIAGWGENGALETVTESAQLIDTLAHRVEAALTTPDDATKPSDRGKAVSLTTSRTQSAAGHTR